MQGAGLRAQGSGYGCRVEGSGLRVGVPEEASSADKEGGSKGHPEALEGGALVIPGGGGISSPLAPRGREEQNNNNNNNNTDYGGYVILHTAHHTIITMDHGCRHPNLLTDYSQAVFVCCTTQVSYGLLGVGVCR